MSSPLDLGDIKTSRENGTEYFVCGKYRIKISEHFAAIGRPLNELLAKTIYEENKIKSAQKRLF